MDNAKIFVVTHKSYKFPKIDLYSPLLVGAYKNKIECNIKYYKDNEKQNISNKNNTYCELTGLYWIWKNALEDYDVIGLEHYRRYFFKKKNTNDFKYLLDYEDIKKILENYDIILSQKKYTIDGSNYSDYKEHHHIKDLELCKNIIREEYPEYLDAFETVMKREYIYPFNMFIMKNNLLGDYCTWIFSILDKVERKIDITEYDNYNKRVFGFLAERLFNVWIEKHKLKIKSVYVKNIETKNRKDDFENFIKHVAIKSPFNNIISKKVGKLRKEGKKNDLRNDSFI